MVSNADLVTAGLARIPDVRRKTAIFVGRVGVKAQVNLAGGTSPILPYASGSFPTPGDPVQLELRDGEWVVTGPARPKPGEGIITGTGTPRAKVTAWGVEYELRLDPSYTAVLADRVTISWSADGEGVITGKVSAASNALTPGSSGGGGLQTFHPDAFTAIDSGSYRGSAWWTNDVYSAINNDSAWFYGSKIRDTIPDTAVILSAYIYIPIRAININADGVMKMHTNSVKGSTPPAWAGGPYNQLVPPATGWHAIPTFWVDYMKANDAGIGFETGGYWVAKGTGSDAYSGALDITYQA